MTISTVTASNAFSQWTSLTDNSLTVEIVQQHLNVIPDDLWVTAACVDRLVEDVMVQRALLELGIERTATAVEQSKHALSNSQGITDVEDIGDNLGELEHPENTPPPSLMAHFRNVPAHAQLCGMRAVLLERLDRLNTFVEISKEVPQTEEEEWEDDPWADETAESSSKSSILVGPPVSLSTFLTDGLPLTSCLLASRQWFAALQKVVKRHGSCVWPYRFNIMESIPEHAPPTQYLNILPGFDTSANVEQAWVSSGWRAEPDWSETCDVQAAIRASGIETHISSVFPPAAVPYIPHPEPLTTHELTTWYAGRVDLIITSTGMVDIALATIQHGASQGVPELDELGEELSLLSRLVYDAPRSEDSEEDEDWTLNRWKSMGPPSIVRAYLAHSTPDTIVNDILRLVLPYLFVLESRAERAGKPDLSLHNRLLYDYILAAPLDFAAAVFEASKPTLPLAQRLIKNDDDTAKLALACLYGSDSLKEWPTMSRIFECLPAWDIKEDDESEGDVADTTVASLGEFVTPSTTRPSCTASDLLLFFDPLSQTSLSRALDILDVHLESGEILSRWGVPAPLRWFLQSSNDAAEQRAWANRMARRAGGSEDTLDTQEDWSWLLEDMLKLTGPAAGESGLKGAFGLLTRQEVINIFFSGLLSTGQFGIARELLYSSKSKLSLNPEAVEDICLACSREFYDNASSGNYKFGDMKLAYKCLDVPHPSDRLLKEKEFIEATSRLSSFNVMSRPGIPISPIEIRLTKDRLSLVSRVLSSNTDAYKHTEVILDLVYKLGFRDDAAAEVKVFAMLADVALQAEDFTRAYDTSRRMIDTVLALRSSSPMGIEDPKVQEASEVCWVACFQLGRQPEFDDVEKKLSLLGRAVELCPPDKLHDVLVAWRRLEKEDIEIRQEKLARRRSGMVATPTTNHAAPSINSLAARLQGFRMSTSPLLKTPDAAALASRTLRSVAANFPFSVSGRGSFQGHESHAGANENRRRPDGGDVSAQASRVLSKGIGWLIGDDI